MKTTEELLVRIINALAETLRGKLVLKGGMLLRLMNSPRLTQDVDFALISNESRRVLVEPIKKTLLGIGGVSLGEIRLNSRGIFVEVLDSSSELRVLVEISLVPKTNLAPEPLSTGVLARQYSLEGRMISTMAQPEVFAHKIAACLEREVARDIYDLSVLEPMGPFDKKTLRDRLSQLSVNRAKPIQIDFAQAARLLRTRLNNLTEKKLISEVYPLIPPDYRPGLLLLIRACVSRIVQRMEIAA